MHGGVSCQREMQNMRRRSSVILCAAKLISQLSAQAEITKPLSTDKVVFRFFFFPEVDISTAADKNNLLM